MKTMRGMTAVAVMMVAVTASAQSAPDEGACFEFAIPTSVAS